MDFLLLVPVYVLTLSEWKILDWPRAGNQAHLVAKGLAQDIQWAWDFMWEYEKIWNWTVVTVHHSVTVPNATEL